MTKRFDFIDALKGIGIVLVVWGHSYNPFVKSIYTFHIPLFFFLSGYFYKHIDFETFTSSKIKRLLLPYAFFFVFGLVFNGLIQGIHSVISNKPINIEWQSLLKIVNGSEKLPYNSPLWFLLSLFEVMVLYWVIIAITLRLKTSIRFLHYSAVLSSMIGYNLYRKGINLPFYVDSSITSFIFFHWGFYLSQMVKFPPIYRIPQHYFSKILLILFWAICFWFFNDLSSNIDLRTNTINSPYLVFLATVLSAIGFFWWLVKFKFIVVIFKYLGQNSMWIMCVHIPLFVVIDFVLTKGIHLDINTTTGGIVRTIIALGLSLIVSKLIDRYLTFLK